MCPRISSHTHTRAKLRVACWLPPKNRSIVIRSETAMTLDIHWMCVCFYSDKKHTARGVRTFHPSSFPSSLPPKKKSDYEEIWALRKVKFVIPMAIPLLIIKNCTFFYSWNLLTLSVDWFDCSFCVSFDRFFFSLFFFFCRSLY